MLLGARQFFTTKSGNAEEEMYKEFFIGLTEDTLPETVVVPADVTKIGREFWLMSSTCKDITFLADMTSFKNNNTAYGSPNLKIIRMPNQTSISYPGPTMNGGAEELHIPNVKSFGTRTYVFGTSASRLDIYIDNSTCAQIMAFPNFSGATPGQESKLFFHGSDGIISYDGSSWIITPNS